MIFDRLHREHRRVVVSAAILMAALLVAFYLFVDPASGIYPSCTFKMLTGLSCPGCGSQRAVHALLHGDLQGAFSYNALFIIELPLLALLCYTALPSARSGRLRTFLLSQPFILTLLAVIILWTIVRNIFDI